MSEKLSVGRVAGEFALIVVGVLVALAANNWRDARHDRETARGYETRLAAEVRDGLAHQARQRGRLEKARDASARLVGYLEDGRSPAPTDSLARLFLLSSVVGFAPGQLGSDATYRELIASGQLGLLGDPVLRRRLLTYYGALDEVRAFIDRMPPMYDQIARLTGTLPYRLLRDDPPLSTGDRTRLARELEVNRGMVPELRQAHADITMVLETMDYLKADGDSLLASLHGGT